MSMFTNYNLTPKDYIPNNLHMDDRIPPKPKYPLIAYNSFDEPVGFTWNYGDTVWLEFTTTGNVTYEDGEIDGVEAGHTEDAEMYLNGKKFKVLVYDFRYNVVAWCECDAAPNVKVLSDSFYPCSLVPGVYHLKLTLVDESNNSLITLIDNNDCILYIK